MLRALWTKLAFLRPDLILTLARIEIKISIPLPLESHSHEGHYCPYYVVRTGYSRHTCSNYVHFSVLLHTPPNLFWRDFSATFTEYSLCCGLLTCYGDELNLKPFRSEQGPLGYISDRNEAPLGYLTGTE